MCLFFFQTTNSFWDVIKYASMLNGDGFKLLNLTNTTLNEFIVLYGALEQKSVHSSFIEEAIGSG